MERIQQLDLQKSITLILDGLKAGANPEDDPVSHGKVLETSLRQLLVLCHEHNDGKSFSAEQYAFLHGYLAAMLAMRG